MGFFFLSPRPALASAVSGDCLAHPFAVGSKCLTQIRRHALPPQFVEEQRLFPPFQIFAQVCRAARRYRAVRRPSSGGRSSYNTNRTDERYEVMGLRKWGIGARMSLAFAVVVVLLAVVAAVGVRALGSMKIGRAHV